MGMAWATDAFNARPMTLTRVGEAFGSGDSAGCTEP